MARKVDGLYLYLERNDGFEKVLSGEPCRLCASCSLFFSERSSFQVLPGGEKKGVYPFLSFPSRPVVYISASASHVSLCKGDAAHSGRSLATQFFAPSESVMAAVARGYAGTATGITFLTIATLTLVARLYTRFGLVKNAGVEEYAIIAAWIFSVAHVSLVCVGMHQSFLDFMAAADEALKRSKMALEVA